MPRRAARANPGAVPLVRGFAPVGQRPNHGRSPELLRNLPARHSLASHQAAEPYPRSDAAEPYRTERRGGAVSTERRGGAVSNGATRQSRIERSEILEQRYLLSS